MTFVRPARRVLIAAASLSALFVAAACGGGGGGGAAPEGGGTSAPAVDFTKQGDIELWQGKDISGNLPKLVKQFNESHPNGKVTLHELPDEADQQRQQMIQNTQIKNPKMAVLSVDVVWTAEFAANSYVEALPPDLFPTDGHLKPDRRLGDLLQQALRDPSTSDGGLLYYRKDLLDKYSLQPPTTFDEMKAACDKITAGENNSKLGVLCRPVQQVRGPDGELRRGRPRCGWCHRWSMTASRMWPPRRPLRACRHSTDWFKDGHIPKAAITWTEEEGRQAFQNGELIFHRNWGYVYTLANKTDGSSKVEGKFDVAPLPGITGLVCPALVVHNLRDRQESRRTRVRRWTS